MTCSAKCIRWFAGLFLFCSACSCSTEPARGSLEGKEISALSVRIRDREASVEGRITRLIRSQPGTRYSSKQIDEDLVALHESGLIDNAEFQTSGHGETIHLHVEIWLRPPPGPARFSGHTAFSATRLARIADLTARSPDALALESARLKLEKFYHEQGFSRARVHLARPHGKENFIFVIEEGPGT